MKRLIAAAALSFAAVLPVQADEFSSEQKAAIDAQIRAYLLQNPEVIVEAMQVLEQRQQENARQADISKIDRLSNEILNDGYSFVAGNPDGDVTVVEFLDYRCGYCKKAHSEVKSLIESDGQIRYVIKEFPILGPESTYAARAAMAAQAQDGERYLAFNDAMMTHQGGLDAGAVADLAAGAGLDVDRMLKDMESPRIAENIRRTYALARELEIKGTPGFVIGGQIVRGYVPYDALRELVDEARENG